MSLDVTVKKLIKPNLVSFYGDSDQSFNLFVPSTTFGANLETTLGKNFYMRVKFL